MSTIIRLVAHGAYVPKSSDCSDYSEPDALELAFRANQKDARHFLYGLGMFLLGMAFHYALVRAW